MGTESYLLRPTMRDTWVASERTSRAYINTSYSRSITTETPEEARMDFFSKRSRISLVYLSLYVSESYSSFSLVTWAIFFFVSACFTFTCLYLRLFFSSRLSLVGLPCFYSHVISISWRLSISLIAK
jgi:hypothetical protein